MLEQDQGMAECSTREEKMPTEAQERLLMKRNKTRKGTWYWRIWWWFGYHGLYQINWWWKNGGKLNWKKPNN